MLGMVQLEPGDVLAHTRFRAYVLRVNPRIFEAMWPWDGDDGLGCVREGPLLTFASRRARAMALRDMLDARVSPDDTLQPSRNPPARFEVSLEWR